MDLYEVNTTYVNKFIYTTHFLFPSSDSPIFLRRSASFFISCLLYSHYNDARVYKVSFHRISTMFNLNFTYLFDLSHFIISYLYRFLSFYLLFIYLFIPFFFLLRSCFLFLISGFSSASSLPFFVLFFACSSSRSSLRYRRCFFASLYASLFPSPDESHHL